jgi:hypothetical protein
MIHVDDIPLNGVVFSHVVEAEGVVHHFWIDRLEVLVNDALADDSGDRGYVEICKTALEPDVAMAFRNTRGIEQRKLDAIPSNTAQEMPLLVCVMKEHDMTLLVDGHHRYVKWCDAGWEDVVCVLIQPEVWKKCLISGMPAMTEDDVLGLPRKPAP